MAKKGAGKTTTETGTKSGRGAKVEKLRPEEMAQSKAATGLTHAQIAQRAREIWERNGRADGQDEKNWRQAEEELKREMSRG
jgi:hypothetical protein